ncbi:MAG: ATP-dependent 6-phosphofructokinase [Candidatus Zixiibacteriota bacterium]|nr:MAG: ATP-dependent 6-phosphofructokinase [candidate division Zixibacteria bacterium]
MNKIKKRIGVLTGGGDCPGLNAVIRAIVKTADNDYDVEVIGFKDGYEGLIDNRFLEIDSRNVSGILARGGTILGTSNRADPFNYPVLQDDDYVYLDRSSQAVRNFEALGLDALIAIGGDGTMAASAGMVKKGLPIVGVPKTIDNDLVGTDVTFGFDSALVTATEAIDKIHTTAQSHHRVMIVEVMGRYAGWLALYSGVAGGGDIILMPEFPYDIRGVCDAVRTRNAQGKTFSIVVVGEGAKPIGGDMVVARKVKTSPDALRLGGISHQVAAQIEGMINIECRVTILGHLLRGGTPSAFDRILATRFGVESVHMAARGEFGKMVVLRNNQMESVALEDVAGKLRLVTTDHEMIQTALSLGLSLGCPSDVPFAEFYTKLAETH